MAQLGLLLCILLDDIVYPWLVALNHWTRCWSTHGSPLCLREWNNWANTQANQLEWPLVTKWLQQFLGSSVVLVWHLIEIFRTICLCTRSSGNLFQHHNHFQEQWSPTDQLRIFKYRVFQKNSFRIFLVIYRILNILTIRGKSGHFRKFYMGSWLNPIWTDPFDWSWANCALACFFRGLAMAMAMYPRSVLIGLKMA